MHGNANDGIASKDSLVIESGTIAVTAGGDGLKADNSEDATKGYVAIEGGTLTGTAGGDGVDAVTDVVVSDGTVQVTAGGGSTATIADDASAKGLKGSVAVVVDGGAVTDDATDDAVHSNSGGDIDTTSTDDGLNAGSAMTVGGGTVVHIVSADGRCSPRLPRASRSRRWPSRRRTSRAARPTPCTPVVRPAVNRPVG